MRALAAVAAVATAGAGLAPAAHVTLQRELGQPVHGERPDLDGRSALAREPDAAAVAGEADAADGLAKEELELSTKGSKLRPSGPADLVPFGASIGSQTTLTPAPMEMSRAMIVK